MISLFQIFLLLTMLLPLAVKGQKPDRELLTHEQLIFDQIISRLEPALINYYNGHPLAYGALFHNDGIYAGQTNRYTGEAEINKTFARWEGETNFDAKISSTQFMVLDSTNALLAYNVQEDDHTFWLGSEVWTKKDGNWGLSYAHWAYQDLNLIVGLPKQHFWYGLVGLLFLLVLGFLGGRISSRRVNQKD